MLIFCTCRSYTSDVAIGPGGGKVVSQLAAQHMIVVER